ncbi:hypothetical protein [Sphingomonas glaciei]|uniref:Uncharacterized protein n=1 Tax=Sphingomonas glaciei TaxID=2938948 RepID=A0ABY5MTM6_9SPHN|nr:hypothetical protein [Sphingomonas glaciei]UUR07782.1 hypothetical protein M1K48_12745 [Sphingomonas glaciei]
MNIDDLLQRTFGTSDLGTITPAALEAGIERLQVDLGLATDRDQRFALWSLLYTLGSAPDLDVAFPDPADRDAARNLMDLIAASGGE